MKDRRDARKTNHFAMAAFRFETKGLGLLFPAPGNFYKKPLWEIANSAKLRDKLLQGLLGDTRRGLVGG
jgi:hypothetical protein